MFTYPVGYFRVSRFVVPEGLIVPYNDTTAPDGWTLFTSADGRFIVGAGSSYSCDSTGGSTSITTASSDSQGAHTGSTKLQYYFNNDIDTASGENSAGSHNHTLTYDYTPPYYGLRLIKNNANCYTFPAKAVLFAGSSMNGLTRFSSGDGKLFSARSSLGAGGNNTISGFTSSSAGLHQHGTYNSAGTTTNGSRGIIATGDHTHPNTDFTITPNLYRALLSAWTDASKDFNLQTGMYAFWQSSTPPSGWAICNGNNGTLDLRNYFIQFTDESDDGTRTGDGTISVPNITLTSSSWTHSHAKTNVLSSGKAYHASYSATHSHTITGTSPSFTPPYYALYIITFKG